MPIIPASPSTSVLSRSAALKQRNLPVVAFAYVWTAPNTLVGLVVGLVMVACGAQLQRREGVVECHGGVFGRWLSALPHPFCFAAITLGHVILATDAQQLAASREHELVHVRQYERWGALFLPAYALSSAWQLVRGRRPYRDNVFEREAYAVDAAQCAQAGDPTRHTP